MYTVVARVYGISTCTYGINVRCIMITDGVGLDITDDDRGLIVCNNISEEKLYQCPYCPKVYTTTQSLHRHKHSHTGTNMKACPLCGKTSYRVDNLKSHIRNCYKKRIRLENVGGVPLATTTSTGGDGDGDGGGGDGSPPSSSIEIPQQNYSH